MPAVAACAGCAIGDFRAFTRREFFPGEAGFCAPAAVASDVGKLPTGFIVGRSLVLWDHHASLIVDFLPGALTT